MGRTRKTFPRSWRGALPLAFAGGSLLPACVPPRLDPLDPAVDVYQAGVGGSVWIGVSRHDAGGGADLSFGAGAQFFTVRLEPTDDPQAQEIDPLTGIDDCGLVLQSGMGVGNPGDVVYGEVGDLTVGSGPDQAPLTLSDVNDCCPSYHADLAALGLEPRHGEPYSFEADGSELPGFALDDAVILPADLEVSEPTIADGAVLPAGDVGFRWTGAPGDEPLLLLFWAQEGDSFSPWYELTCWMADDGDFEVPGAILSEIPSGWGGHFAVGRLSRAFVEASLGRWIYVSASTSVSATVFRE